MDVKPGAATQNRSLASVTDVFVGIFKGLLPLVEVESCASGHNVYKVIRDIAIFIQVLSGPDVHAAIDLTGIGGEDFTVAAFVRQLHGEARLSGGGGSKHDDQINRSGSIFIEYAPEVDGLRFRKGSRWRDGNCFPQLVLWISAHPLVTEI